MHQIPLHDQLVLHQSQVSSFRSEGQQDHRTMVSNLNKTTKDQQEFSSREWSATGLTPSVTGVLEGLDCILLDHVMISFLLLGLFYTYAGHFLPYAGRFSPHLMTCIKFVNAY